MPTQNVSVELVTKVIKQACEDKILASGVVFKDWKEVCSSLGLPYYGNNTNRKRMYTRVLSNFVSVVASSSRKITIASIHEQEVSPLHGNCVWKGLLEPVLFDYLESKLISPTEPSFIDTDTESLCIALGLLQHRLRTTENFSYHYPEFLGLTNLNPKALEAEVFKLIDDRYDKVVSTLLSRLCKEAFIIYRYTYRVVYANGASKVLDDTEALHMLDCMAQVMKSCNVTSLYKIYVTNRYKEFIYKSANLYNAGRLNEIVSIKRVHSIGCSKNLLDLARIKYREQGSKQSVGKKAVVSLDKTVSKPDWYGLASEEELQAVIASGDVPIARNEKEGEMKKKVVRKHVGV